MSKLQHSFLFTVALSITTMFGFSQNKINPNGYNVFYYDNGNISSEGYMLNGKPDGYWKTYYENKVLKSEGNRKNQELDSLWMFYNKGGMMVMEINYKGGFKNGVKRRYNKGGSVTSEEMFVNDMKNGVSKYYFKDGNIKEKSNYEKGYKQGKTLEYSKDGYVIAILTFENDFIVKKELINRRNKKGLKTGVWKVFHKNGFINLEGKYVNGKREGYFREYSEDFKLLNTYKYLNGELIEDVERSADIKIDKEYYPGAKVKSEMTLVNGVPNGVYREYSINGEITGSKIYRNGNIIGTGIVDKKGNKQNDWIEFYIIPFINIDSSVAAKKANGVYKNGVKIGEWVYYHDNGSVEQKGTYLNGRPDGIWKWYFESGNLLREEEFENGLENGYIKEYSDSGNLITKGEYFYSKKEGHWEYEMGDYKEFGNYKDGNKEGIWKHYYGNEELSFEGEFVDGEPNGKHKYYYKGGKLKEEGTYIMGLKEGNWKRYDKEGKVYILETYESGVEIKIDGVKIKPETEPQDR